MLETQLYLVNGVVALLASAIPIYLTIKLNDNLKRLTAVLSIFILIYAVYCWLDYFGFDFLSDGVFEPLSAAVLMFFGISYYEVAKQKKLDIKKTVIIWSPVAVLFIFFGTMIFLLAALSIFVWLAVRSKDIRSFQFQISIFIIIWVLGGVVYILQDSEIIMSPLQAHIGLELHVLSLIFLSVMIWVRFFYSQRNRKRAIEAFDTK
jgi:hypothetical protein